MSRVRQNDDKRGCVPCTAKRHNIIIHALCLLFIYYSDIYIIILIHPTSSTHTHLFKTSSTHAYEYTRVYNIHDTGTAVSCDTLTRFASSRHFHPFCCCRTLYYIILYTHTYAHESALSIIRTHEIGTYNKIPVSILLYVYNIYTLQIIMGRRAASHCGDA